jgi:hypothetical protein
MTVEDIFSGEVYTTHWMGKQGAVVVVAADECTNKENHE